jgi:hypothetical protein
MLLCACAAVITLEFLSFNHQFLTTQYGDLELWLDGVGGVGGMLQWPVGGVVPGWLKISFVLV